MNPLQTLVEDPRGGIPLPPALHDLYGGDLMVPEQGVYSNFVGSLDGVVALGDAAASSGPAISGRSEADRFVMGLLRAAADCVLIGAGTFRDDPGVLWTPGFVYPDLAGEFAALRRTLGLPEAPALAVLTASGELDRSRRAFSEQEVIVVGPGWEPAAEVIAGLRARGFRRVLCEGGPHLLGELVRARLLDEIFLTLSPVLAGSATDHVRLKMVEGVELLPAEGAWCRLLGLKRHGGHLFLHYSVNRDG
ncbi:MAG TPA: dihydrofolate reductase family protein [Candidatus Dormibacteraeota bacterium]